MTTTTNQGSTTQKRITVTWCATGAVCTTFTSLASLGRWLATERHGVLSKLGTHPSVDLRDVEIPGWAMAAAWDLVEDKHFHIVGRCV